MKNEKKEPPITDDELIILRHFIYVNRLIVGPNKKVVRIPDPREEKKKTIFNSIVDAFLK